MRAVVFQIKYREARMLAIALSLTDHVSKKRMELLEPVCDRILLSVKASDNTWASQQDPDSWLPVDGAPPSPQEIALRSLHQHVFHEFVNLTDGMVIDLEQFMAGSASKRLDAPAQQSV